MSKSLEILKKYWGYSSFRPMQEEIIMSVLNGRDTLALLPTGGGKSVCFQVPALCMDGLCLVISPLIALMKDQVNHLAKRGIKAVFIHSGMKFKEIDLMLDNCIYGDIKFLYLSPERLKSDLLLERVGKMNVNLLAIDEAHCISQWGYDFRPSYLEINNFKKLLPTSKLIALTATATIRVQDDIINKLEMEQAAVFQKSFARKNLSYSVFQKENKEQKLIEILNKVPGSAVVYTKSRRKTKSIADLLNQNRISADYYHAGLSNQERNKKQENWIGNKSRVIVATNAFGMGIDKADVRTVVHLDVPDSLENYYQEAGRAGRDEKRAFAVLLYNPGDIKELKDQVETSFPAIEAIKKIYQGLANYFKIAVGSSYLESYDFDLENFSKAMGYKPFEAFNLLKKLEDLGLIQLNDGFHQPSQLQISITKQDLYKFQIENAPLEPIIQSVLRLCGGEIFSNYVTVFEDQVARLARVAKTEVIRILNQLGTQNIIHYIGQKDSPQIVFLTPRQDASKLNIDKRKFETRKQVKTTQVEAIVKYVLTLNRCRTRVFQEYFGEATFNNCGSCDYCISQKNKSGVSARQIEAEIIKVLVDKPRSISFIGSIMPKTREDVLIDAIRQLLDKEQIRYTKTGLLERV
ncbi:MAG: RecQ family ATP-dependent DNA helicase [Bacteroidetes bacterium]|nr:RecQ family ATP-dependent DNA helicase [Bacteroidota bacterium]MDA1119334.1 RecQ family ATP-dependent DNA helicase [Bacteroidota bacterium]